MTDEYLTFCVCTYNAQRTIGDCLGSIRRVAPNSRIIVVDHSSEDNTSQIAESFGAEIFLENRGLGYARQLSFEISKTPFVVFVDSDVEIVNQDFLSIGREILKKKEFGAVVGLAVGHLFAYGLPASLLMLRRADFQGPVIPSNVEGRETHYIQYRLDSLKLRTYYVYHSILHRSEDRRYMPEYQGAYTRLLPSSSLKELTFSLEVITLRALNSRSAKNILYIPIFCGKFLRGYWNPQRWVRKREVKVVKQN